MSTALSFADDIQLDWYPNAALNDLRQTQSHVPQDSHLCGGAYWEPPRKNLSLTTPIAGSILGTAGSYEYSQDRALLKDGVTLQQNDLQVESDQVALDFNKQLADIQGHIQFRTPGFLLTGQTAQLNTQTQEADFLNASYLAHLNQVRGQAEKIHFDSNHVLTIHHGTYTGCPPTQNDWHFSGQKIRIDQNAGWGTATNMVLFLGRAPVLYLPYFTFPTDNQRHSGLLYPTIYNLSDGDVSIPIYFNIAPNYDDTLTPRNLGNRGILWQNEFRFLTEKIGEGKITSNYLAKDSDYQNQARYSFGWQQKAFWQDRWAFNLDYNRASDVHYFNDFEHSLNVASASQLNQNTTLSYQGETWRGQIQLQAYQTIDNTVALADYPYRQLPKINFQKNITLAQSDHQKLNWQNQVEYVYFTQPTVDTDPDVQRAHLESNINYAWENSWFFFKPKLALLTTAYDIQDKINTHHSQQYRTLPQLNVDTGLYFQRSVILNEKHYWQTLEPRLFYLYVPYRDQSNLPLLDTSALNFDLEQLFRINQFSGIDRINDAHRLSLSLGSRLYNTYGQAVISTELGQIFYIKGQEVALTGNNTETTKSSSHLLSNTQIQWQKDTRSLLNFELNQNTQKIEALRTDTQWHPQNDSLFNLSYRYRQANDGLTALQQAQTSIEKPITGRWRAIGAWTYDLNDHKSFEYLGGAIYETCCWRTALVLRQQLTQDDITLEIMPRYTTLLTLELKGLGQLGDHLEKTLSETIPGLDNYKP